MPTDVQYAGLALIWKSIDHHIGDDDPQRG
jgi:hypothetical protein